MKTYRLSFARSTEHIPEHPERTAVRQMRGDDMEYRVYSSSGAMEESIWMQSRRASKSTDWKPWLSTNTARRLKAAGKF